MEGVVYAPEGQYYVEPLRNYLPSASAEELVVYDDSDLKTGEALKCGLSLPKRLQQGVEQVRAQVEASATTPNKYEFDVATDADYEYVQALGGSEKANREILGIMNQVEGVYQSELLLQLRISFQHAWDIEDDPYTATNDSGLLDEFIIYWNANFAAEETYDLAHLWSGKVLEGGIQGQAVVGVVCFTRRFSYSMSTIQNHIPAKYIIPAHEIGHNFGASHPHEVDPSVEGCTNTLMSVVTSGGGRERQLTFCQFSRQEIADFVSDNHHCLTPRPISLNPPSNLSATADSESRITLAWQDNSTNETGFLVQRRQEGLGIWVTAGTAGSNAESFSDGGLYSSTTYIYRVQAFNDAESSAFSNEAVATTLNRRDTSSGWIIDTIAGGRNNEGDNGPAVAARLHDPGGLAVDGSGNLYIADSTHNRIRRVDAFGAITTVAGTGGAGYSGDGGAAVGARLNAPSDVAVDGSGNLYVADLGNHRIRRVSRSGTITTVAGTGKRGYSGDGGAAAGARLSAPSGVAVDSAGNLYVADLGNHRIRRVSRSGTITTVAGTGESGFSGDGGLASAARLGSAGRVMVDGSGNLFIVDRGNHRIRRVNPSGTITTVAGTGEIGLTGDGGPAIRARLSFPADVAVDASGNLYIGLSNHVRRVDRSGTISTVAGTGKQGFSGDGGPAVAAQLAGDVSVVVDASGNLYIADIRNRRIRRVDSSGTITTIAGIGESGYGGDGGPANQARLFRPRGVAVDRAGNLFIADQYNGRIRRVDRSGMISTVAGNGEDGYGGDGGPAVEAVLNRPADVAVDRIGNLYITDRRNNRIRRVDPSGTITTFAGTGEPGYGGDGGPAVAARLLGPGGLALDGAGNLYFADGSNRIRRVDRSGTITTVAGTGTHGFSGDGGPAIAARLWFPYAVALDGRGNLYFSDNANHRVRKVDRFGIITTVAGVGLSSYNPGPGPAVEVALDRPSGLAVDRTGNLYIADSYYNHIRRVDAGGTISIIGGDGRNGYSGDGGPAKEAQLFFPRGLALDNAGNIYVTDTWNHRVRVMARPPRSPTRLTATAVSSSRIRLAWQDNSANETGFRVERRFGNRSDWVEIGTTAANVTTFTDTGLAPTTNYAYRVRAFVHTLASGFSNQARATTLEATPPTVIRFEPAGGPVGTTVTLTGTAFLDAIAVAFNAVSATEFEILSETSIEAVVPPGATSGPVSVVTPGGTGVSAETFTVVLPPTVTVIAPKVGPVGTRVTLTGTYFLGAAEVLFNGVGAVEFEVLSSMSIEALVPPGATSGPISVVTPGGTAVSTEPFTVTTGIRSRLFVPIVLRSQGRTPGSFFTSELTLTNRGTTTAMIDYTFTAAIGAGSGTAVDSLEPGRQRVIPYAIAYLTSLGIPIGGGAAGGTLAVDFSNLSSPSDAAVTVRVATPVEEGSGRAGLAFPGLDSDGLLTAPAFITGLRQNRQDRSNLALQSAGDASDGSITLRVTVYSGDPEAPGSLVLPDLSLSPGGFHQYNGILTEAGFDNGYAKVERVKGTAPYYAYGVINDNFNSDGSFVFPVREASLEGSRGQTLPVIIETEDFASELTVTNFSSVPKTVDFRFVSEAVETDGDTASFSLRLEAGEQRILPGIVDWLRRQEVAGVGAADEALVGAVFATVAEGDMSGIAMGARTGSPDARGGLYSLFYDGVSYGSASTQSAWIYGLQQNEQNRSNLALVNTGEVDDSEVTLEIDIYDGEGDSEPRTRSVRLGPRRWHQLNGILGNRRQGYVEVRKTMGINPLIAYGVINDGGKRGQRSGDGAFLPSQE